MASAVVLVSSSPVTKSRTPGMKLSALDGEPEQLGELRDDDRHGDAHQVAHAHRHRQQLGHEAEPRQPAGEHDRADQDREHAGERDPLPTRRLAAASGMIAAATSGETAESGPRTRIRDGPSRKYTTSGTSVA